MEGKLTRRRSRTEWITNIKEWMGMRYEDLVRLAQSREQWRIWMKTALDYDDDDDLLN